MTRYDDRCFGCVSLVRLYRSSCHGDTRTSGFVYLVYSVVPYIKQERRDDLNAAGDAPQARTSGELNYLITLAITDYVDFHGLIYDTLNDVLGALEGAKLEFVRRVVVPYEMVKRIENGDVYDE